MGRGYPEQSKSFDALSLPQFIFGIWVERRWFLDQLIVFFYVFFYQVSKKMSITYHYKQ